MQYIIHVLDMIIELLKKSKIRTLTTFYMCFRSTNILVDPVSTIMTLLSLWFLSYFMTIFLYEEELNNLAEGNPMNLVNDNEKHETVAALLFVNWLILVSYYLLTYLLIVGK